MPEPATAVDAHCHVDVYLDREAVLDAAAAADVIPIIVTNRPSEYRNLLPFVGERQGVRLALGLHPEAAGSSYVDHEMRTLRHHFASASWIGEVGLDATLTTVGSSFVMGDPPTLETQEAMLESILELGVADKVMSVHSRFAEHRLVDLLVAAGAKSVVFHWYHGDLDSARLVIDAGFSLSINPEMLNSASGAEVVRWLPREHLLLETDGPFIAWRDEIAEPKDIPEIAQVVADAREEAVDSLLESAMNNFAALEARAFG